MRKALSTISLALAFVVLTATAALACHFTGASGSGVCQDNGMYLVTFTETHSDDPGVSVTWSQGNPVVVGGDTTSVTNVASLFQTVTGEGGTHTYLRDTTRVTVQLEGECTPKLDKYRVVAGMPFYRGKAFTAAPGLTGGECELLRGAKFWRTTCGDHVDSGRITPHRTYIRLRDLTDGTFTVIKDFR